MKTFNVLCSQTLSKEVDINTSDYSLQEEIDYDDDGNSLYHSWVDTSDTDWKEAYKNDAMTPLDIITACRHICTYLHTNNIPVNNFNLQSLIHSCEGWIEDELCVIEN